MTGSISRARRAAVCWCLALLSGAAVAPAHAEQFRRYDQWVVHYNAVRADFIPAEVAVAQGITRSKARGLVNITVLRTRDDGNTEPSEAQITLSVSNLAGQSQSVRLRPVRETGALYYIGEFRIGGQDTYRFDAELQPFGSEQVYKLKFAQELVAE
jgi:Domain of unknown function (DUF4426)